MKKLKEILLVDDSRGSNSLNKRLLKEMGVAQHVSTALNGRIALDYLTTKNEQGELPKPEIIFLDINMPVIDGYQFLEELSKLEQEAKTNVSIIILTTSINETEKARANRYQLVKAYQFKPLTKEKVLDVMGLV